MNRALEPAGTYEPLTPYRDLAGLAVHDCDDLRAGRVFGVLTEQDTGLVRYLDVDLEADQRHVLVPIGHARLDAGITEPRFRLRAVRVEDLSNIPSYDGGSDWQVAEYASKLAAEYGRFFRGAQYYAHPAYDHSALYAGPHPIVLPSATPDAQSLVLLSSSDYRIARGEPDVLDWSVTDGNGALLGRTADLLVDPQAGKARYVVLELPDATRRLLPVGYLEIDGAKKALRIPGLLAADVTALPELDVETLEREQEEELLQTIERALDARNPFLRVDYSDREVRTYKAVP